MTSGTATDTPQTLPEARKFSAKAEAELTQLLTRYPNKKAALLMAFRIAETDFGCIDWGALRLVAEKLDLTPAYVWGVFSFYSHYRRPTDGKYVIEVCRTLPCALRGADKFAEYCSKKLGINAGETTKDGKFTLKWGECQATCDLAPSLEVNSVDYTQMTPEKFDKMLEALP